MNASISLCCVLALVAVISLIVNWFQAYEGAETRKDWRQMRRERDKAVDRECIWKHQHDAIKADRERLREQLEGVKAIVAPEPEKEE